MTTADLVLAANYVVLWYFLIVSGVCLALYVLSFLEVSDHMRRGEFSGLSDLFASNYAPPVSVVVPAYNEQATIVQSVRSLLSLSYPLHEVVVVNDGSTDDTLEVLRHEFGLQSSDEPFRQELPTAPVRALYTAPLHRLVVIDKDNAGKSDALNAGTCAATYPLVCCVDADIVLEEDALLRVARPMVESSRVVAVGGIVRVANGSTFDDGRLTEARVPTRPVPGFQVVEYLRAFITTRSAWSRLNCLLIISGAFGLFRRQDLIAAGGYATDTVGEDMELATRLHRTYRERGEPYQISFVPDPVAWTEAPQTLRMLARQRDRWHRGLLDTLLRHRRMLGNPRYGTVGMLAMPYYLVFEVLGPILELLGYVAFAVGLITGVVQLQFAAAFFAVSVGLGIMLSLAAVLLEELHLERHSAGADLVKLTAFALLENLGYRQLTVLWRVRAIASFVRKSDDWGAMERSGFAQGGHGSAATPQSQRTPR